MLDENERLIPLTEEDILASAELRRRSLARWDFFFALAVSVVLICYPWNGWTITRAFCWLAGLAAGFLLRRWRTIGRKRRRHSAAFSRDPESRPGALNE